MNSNVLASFSFQELQKATCLCSFLTSSRHNRNTYLSKKRHVIRSVAFSENCIACEKNAVWMDESKAVNGQRRRDVEQLIYFLIRYISSAY